MIRFKIIQLFALSLAITVLLITQAIAQHNGLDFMSISPNAHALSLNEAVTAVPTGASSLYTNPANLAFSASSLSADYTLWIANAQHSHTAVNLRRGNSAFGFGFFNSNSGRVSGTAGTATSDTNYLSVAGGAARQVGPLAAGVTIHYLREDFGMYNTSGYAISAGLSSPLPLAQDRIEAGLALLNIGDMGSINNVSRTIPALFKMGVNARLYEFTPPKNDDLPVWVSFLADFNHPLTGRESRPAYDPSTSFFNLGLAFNIVETIDLRAALRTHSNDRPFSAGLGLNFQSFKAHYAIIPFRTGYDTVHSLGIEYRL
jgi:hypothetical protein